MGVETGTRGAGVCGAGAGRRRGAPLTLSDSRVFFAPLASWTVAFSTLLYRALSTCSQPVLLRLCIQEALIASFCLPGERCLDTFHLFGLCSNLDSQLILFLLALPSGLTGTPRGALGLWVGLVGEEAQRVPGVVDGWVMLGALYAGGRSSSHCLPLHKKPP